MSSEQGFTASAGTSWLLENSRRAEIGFGYMDDRFAPKEDTSVQLRTFSFTLSYGL
jgi:hypothetical protein